MAVALVAGAVAFASAAISLWGQGRTTRLEATLEKVRLAEQRRFDSERVAAQYREPLARAAYDLQSRIFNILEQNMLQAYYHLGDDRERSYVIDNTAFLFAQYFGWTEAVRRSIQFIDLGQDEETRQLARLQDDVHSLFQTDRFDRTFRVFAGEQRAIGERMLVDSSSGLTCLGYAAFLDKLMTNADSLIETLRSDVCNLASRPDAARRRLVELQHALINLLAFLDSNYVRFPEERRRKAANAG